MFKDTEYYDLLEVGINATEDEIARSYRKLAAKYHPDRNSDDNAEEIFKKITEAKEILLDKKKRKIYDQFGKEGLTSLGQDIFGSFARRPERKAIRMVHKVSLEEVFSKGAVRIKIPITNPCDDCDSTGFVDKIFHKCTECSGMGYILGTQMFANNIIQTRIQCSTCYGTKKIQDRALYCPLCKGSGTVNSEEYVDVQLPDSILGSPHVVLEKKGPIFQGERVDLVIFFKLSLPKDYHLTSDGKLMYTMRINYTETICGFRRRMSHPSGKDILIVSSKGHIINPNAIYFLENLGLDADILYLNFVINYPVNITLPQNIALTYTSLEKALGEKYLPDSKNSDFELEDIYNLSNLRKTINLNEADEADEPDMPEGMPFRPYGPENPQCRTQ